MLVELFRFPVGHPRDSQFFFVNLHAAGILSNIFLLQDLTHTESAIAPLWSLPYEMRMYLLLPLVYLIAKSPLPCSGRSSNIIARYSYSVYLTHFFFIWLAFDQLHNHSLWLRWFVFLFSTITASALLYHYVEEPMISLGHRLSNQLQERRDAPEVAPAN